MDPISQGTMIFKSLAEEFGSTPITERANIKKFFENLLERTGGWVILDFLDLGCWDKIDSFNLDEKIGLLTLTWHDFRSSQESQETKEMQEGLFSVSLYALNIYIKSVIPIVGKDYAVFLINGYSQTQKQIRQSYQKGAIEIKLINKGLFAKRVERKVSDGIEIIDVHCTPIFLLAIIPKNCDMSSGDSKDFLYLYNITESVNRIQNVISSLEQLDPKDEDLICEKVNTARRILEITLKIECCFRNLKINGNYSEMLLGPLSNAVKKVKEENSKISLNKMAELLNEFSHDSGKPVELNKVKVAATMVLVYIELLEREIRLASRFR
ncbi:hypothetical protein [Candidatus Nitrospira allomarina]|uniref:Uncharacterized protein n=1 Tax=Candidatus Nitrospira allomarina TaxID=3020900 RepID=A0AA96GCC9_9BACT|nr:hypothetical protein [Candidatus Nitrospira allomarina]WNM58432.1 hypothetical protein PP769_01330 [Candidatus Nitrospira allomarina]